LSILVSGAIVLAILLGGMLLLILFSLLSMAQREDAQLEKLEEALQAQTGPDPARVGVRDKGPALWSGPEKRTAKKELQPASPG
jgi:hypothetical protein